MRSALPTSQQHVPFVNIIFIFCIPQGGRDSSEVCKAHVSTYSRKQLLSPFLTMAATPRGSAHQHDKEMSTNGVLCLRWYPKTRKTDPALVQSLYIIFSMGVSDLIELTQPLVSGYEVLPP